jgi:hypothetical protein
MHQFLYNIAHSEEFMRAPSNVKKRMGVLVFAHDACMQITEKQSIICFEEFHIEGKLDTWTAHPRGHETVEMGFTETSGGVFQLEHLTEEVSFNYVTLRISSTPNLMPGTYSFTLTVTLQY